MWQSLCSIISSCGISVFHNLCSHWYGLTLVTPFCLSPPMSCLQGCSGFQFLQWTHPSPRKKKPTIKVFWICSFAPGCIRQPAPFTLLLGNVLPAASQGLPSQPHAHPCPPPIKLTSVTLWLHCLLTLTTNTCFVSAAIARFSWQSVQGRVHLIHILAGTLWV